jgi:hypothetical protein
MCSPRSRLNNSIADDCASILARYGVNLAREDAALIWDRLALGDTVHRRDVCYFQPMFIYLCKKKDNLPVRTPIFIKSFCNFRLRPIARAYNSIRKMRNRKDLERYFKADDDYEKGLCVVCFLGIMTEKHGPWLASKQLDWLFCALNRMDLSRVPLSLLADLVAAIVAELCTRLEDYTATEVCEVAQFTSKILNLAGAHLRIELLSGLVSSRLIGIELIASVWLFVFNGVPSDVLASIMRTRLLGLQFSPMAFDSQHLYTEFLSKSVTALGYACKGSLDAIFPDLYNVIKLEGCVAAVRSTWCRYHDKGRFVDQVRKYVNLKDKERHIQDEVRKEEREQYLKAWIGQGLSLQKNYRS